MNAALRWAIVFAVLPGWNPSSYASDDVIESGRRALARTAHLPWYDAEEDQLARIPAAIPKSPPTADQWEWSQKKKTKWSWGRSKTPWLQTTIYLLLGILLAALLLFLIKAAIEGVGAASTNSDPTPNDLEDQRDRIERLPFPIRPPTGDLLEEAHRHATAGRYREASAYLFSYMLVQLDKYQVIRLTKGKTNRQYLREVRVWPKLRIMLSHATVMFEDSFFGDHPIEKERFYAIWNRLDDFRQLLQETRS